MTNKKLFLSLIDSVGSAQLAIIADKKDFNLIHSHLQSATAAAQELKNRQNGELPPPVEVEPKVWDVRELL